MPNDEREQGDQVTNLQLDAVCFAHLSEKQRADLESLPIMLAELDEDELMHRVKDAAIRLDRARQGIMNLDIELADTEDLDAIAMFVSEYLWRTISLAIADEAERRRTGKSPRAKRLN